MSKYPGESGLTSARLLREVHTIAAGAGKTFDARGMAKISVLAATGATVLFSRVKTGTATAHGTETGEVITPPAAGAIVTQDVDWPFYRVSTTDAAAYVALI